MRSTQEPLLFDDRVCMLASQSTALICRIDARDARALMAALFTRLGALWLQSVLQMTERRQHRQTHLDTKAIPGECAY